jgi:phosphatidylglycerophosphate synthase
VSELVAIDCPPGAPGPLAPAAGMSLVERHAREARRDGHEVVVRGEAAVHAALAAAGLTVGALPPDAALPAGAHVVAGDRLCGVEVRDRASRRRAEWALLQTCRRPYDGPGDRFVIRALSLRITRLLAPTSITPTQVTLVNAVVGLLACVAAALAGGGALGLDGRAWLALAGGGLVLSVVLDSSDGELARVKHQTSRRGMILDNVSDDVIDNGFVLCLGIALGPPWLWLGLAAAVARWLQAANIYREVARAGKPGDVMAFRWWFERDAGAVETFADLRSPLTWARSLGRRDTYCLVLGGLALAGLALPALIFGAALCGSYGVMLLAHLALRQR